MSGPQSKSIRASLHELGARFYCKDGAEDALTRITGITYDSREVKPGNAFFCFPGQKVDGNQFIGDAIAAGAACVVSEHAPGTDNEKLIVVADVALALAMASREFYGNPSASLRLLGVTGTNGKTTTTHLVERILNECGRQCGLIGTLGIRSKSAPGYHEAKHTTPLSSDLQRMLAAMRDEGSSHVAMEVSSHALVQKRVTGCDFASACLTNITQDHLDFHKTMDHYWRSKRLLFEQLAASPVKDKLAVVNFDDPLAKEFLAAATNVRQLTYGFSQEADIHVLTTESRLAESLVKLATPEGQVDLRLKLVGRFNVYNVMAALAIAYGEGVSFAQAAGCLENFAGVAGRFEVVSHRRGQEPLCIVDYAHTPDGLENVLKAASGLVNQDGKLIVVFGCGGDRDASKRPQMGEIAEKLATEVFVTSDNPRSEDPQQIIANILAGIKRMRHVRVDADRARAISLAVSQASEKDVVVVAGKGHEDYQILADKVIHFDDREEVLKALKSRVGAASSLNSDR